MPENGRGVTGETPTTWFPPREVLLERVHIDIRTVCVCVCVSEIE